jgi:hypothetical protein
MVSYTDQQWQADLVDMQKYKNYNDDYNYILTVIYLFSRYGWVKPLKRKEGLEVRKAFEEIFLKEKPETINILKINSEKKILNGFLLTLIKKQQLLKDLIEL